MGLAERRAIKAFQDDLYPALLAKVLGALQYEPEVEVDWTALAVDDYGHLYAECIPKVYFDPAVQAFESICADDMGREAMQESVKKIVITNKEGISSASRWSALEGGVLTLDHKPATNIDSIKDRAESLVALLEKAL